MISKGSLKANYRVDDAGQPLGRPVVAKPPTALRRYCPLQIETQTAAGGDEEHDLRQPRVALRRSAPLSMPRYSGASLQRSCMCLAVNTSAAGWTSAPPEISPSIGMPRCSVGFRPKAINRWIRWAAGAGAQHLTSTRARFRVAQADIERPRNRCRALFPSVSGSHHFHRSFPIEIARFRRGFRRSSHWRRSPLRLQFDLTLPPTGTARSNTHQGRTPGRCGRPEHRPISIGIEPEGITPHANVKPGAGSRGIAAAKETCSGTN
jgi:hypothetical protein